MPACTRTVLFLATAAVLQAGCQQPDVNCTSAHGTFAARFEVKKPDAAKPCGQLKGDIIGFQTYYATGGLNGTPKFDEASIAMRASYLYAYVYDVVYAPASLFDLRKMDMEVGDPDALGPFTEGYPDAEGFCQVPTISRVNLNLPEVEEIAPTDPVEDDPMTPDVDETAPGTPGQTGQAAAMLSYQWKALSFLVTPDAQGTQFSADLTFTQDGCSAEYHVVGVYPAIPCFDEMGKPDQSVCDSDENGINPSFPTVCDPDFGHCVLKGEPPAYE